eukprot:TRINITY_DN4680_c0_g1_i1.p1 TRINITY_DN4680_c0_g1~~TRINITY_DN4680_c0_g1_i1.p1  ORF type:complete len:299 (+),score=72.14 TRINITY_DN4680_c0_g1_i1:170-1066(+)
MASTLPGGLSSHVPGSSVGPHGETKDWMHSVMTEHAMTVQAHVDALVYKVEDQASEIHGNNVRVKELLENVATLARKLQEEQTRNQERDVHIARLHRECERLAERQVGLEEEKLQAFGVDPGDNSRLSLRERLSEVRSYVDVQCGVFMDEVMRANAVVNENKTMCDVLKKNFAAMECMLQYIQVTTSIFCLKAQTLPATACLEALQVLMDKEEAIRNIDLFDEKLSRRFQALPLKVSRIVDERRVSVTPSSAMQSEDANARKTFFSLLSSSAPSRLSRRPSDNRRVQVPETLESKVDI